MIIALLLISLSAIPLFWLSSNVRWYNAVSLLASGGALVMGALLTGKVLEDGFVAQGTLFGLYVDSLSILVLDLIVIVSFLVAVYAIGYLEAERKAGHMDARRIKMFYSLMYSFISTMFLSLVTGNIGVLWVAIEGTTLASAFLVGFMNNGLALEASWKYIVICSVGIAMALMGIILLHLSAGGLTESAGNELYWPWMMQYAPYLNWEILKLAFVFIVVGFGTKAGLAPMHTWLPDAHSQAPSPVSALFSAVLLNSSMYGIIRCLAIFNKAVGSEFANDIMIGLGLLSVFAASVFILVQKDYKRILAYSSIEHMGIIAIGIGFFTPAAVYVALIHMVNHSLTKALLFLSAGNVLLAYDSRETTAVSGLLKRLPVTGPMFLTGIFAITGFPPFSIFFSEFGLLSLVFGSNRSWVGWILAMLLSVVFIGFALTLFRMFWGADPAPEEASREPNPGGAIVLAVLTGLILVTSLRMPGPALTLIEQARNIIMGV